MECVFCAVATASLYVIQVNFSLYGVKAFYALLSQNRFFGDSCLTTLEVRRNEEMKDGALTARNYWRHS